VFLLAGAAVRRVVGADIAIHRPYFVDLDPTLSARSVDTRYKRLTREIYEFLAEMNVPAALADAMFTIRPDEGHRLTADELTRYMLDQYDPAHDERRVAKSAAEIGVSMTEYRRREAVFDALAVPVGKVLDCFTAVIREGLNPSTDGRCSAQ
jgi:hypothetical protein